MEALTGNLNRKAFELFVEAKRSLDSYEQSHQLLLLESAKKNLQEALQIDPGYVRARYYNGIVLDLVGQAKDAIDEFETVLRSGQPDHDEIHYNLGVAYYHRYSRRYLEKAAQHFSMVIENSKEGGSLGLLARGCLAQTYAMLMIPSHFDDVDCEFIRKNFDRCASEVRKITLFVTLARVLRFGKAKVDPKTKMEILWTTHNARGMSLMYMSDYFGSSRDRVAYVKLALYHLRLADAYSPRNWANYCDLGSAHMRLGHWLASEEGEADRQFNEALRYLNEVVKVLRPRYGFALYEIGRVYRLMGNFKEATSYLRQALGVDKDYRDVSDSRVNEEMSFSQEHSLSYPSKNSYAISEKQTQVQAYRHFLLSILSRVYARVLSDKFW